MTEHMSAADFRKMRKPHKYRAKPCVVDGIRFDSRKEANKYSELKLLEKAGMITDLQLQVSFPITINGIVVTRYVADFTYKENGEFVVLDVKGWASDVYKLKKKFIKALYNIDILET